MAGAQQQELATQIGVYKATLCGIEKGYRAPRPQEIRVLRAILLATAAAEEQADA